MPFPGSPPSPILALPVLESSNTPSHPNCIRLVDSVEEKCRRESVGQSCDMVEHGVNKAAICYRQTREGRS